MQKLKNPKFEEGFPKDWQIYATGKTQKYSYPELGRTGGSSVAIEYRTKETGKIAALIQSVQIDPTKKYELSGWLKTQDIIGNGASIKVDWKDSSWKYIGSSTIMTRKTGDIPWTYFKGDVVPHPNAAGATIILELNDCSGKVWFDDMSFLMVSPPVQLHPNIFINSKEIEELKQKINSGLQPWKQAYDSMMTNYLPKAINMPNKSVTYQGKNPSPWDDKHYYYTETSYCGWATCTPKPSGTGNKCCDGHINPNADRKDYQAAADVSFAVRTLGLAYALGGNKSYADKAIQLITTWCIDPETRMIPVFTTFSSHIELSVTLPGMFYGADLIWNYWGEKDSVSRDKFKKWVTEIIKSAKSWTWYNNMESWRLVFISSASALAEDVNSREYAFDRWKQKIPDQMNMDGSLKYELARTKSLTYSSYALNAMIQTAEIARHYNVDLYNYKLPDGRGLEKALDFLAPYVTNPSAWKHKQITPYTGVNTALYELAYTRDNKQKYKDAIIKWGRPMYDIYTMGGTTLTHGSSW